MTHNSTVAFCSVVIQRAPPYARVCCRTVPSFIAELATSKEMKNMFMFIFFSIVPRS